MKKLKEKNSFERVVGKKSLTLLEPSKDERIEKVGLKCSKKEFFQIS